MRRPHYLLFPLILLTACNTRPAPDIVTTSFVSYDIVKNIVGDKLTVNNIIPWGSELHSFEPVARDIVAINDAKLFVYATPLLDTWVKNLVVNDNSFDMSAHYEDHHEENDDDHDHASLHFWTNPVWYVEVLDALLPIITRVSPANSHYFSANHASYTTMINNTTNDLRTYLTAFTNPTIYFAGHNAMDAFSDEFGLTIKSLSESYKPDIDFTATDIIAVVDEMVSKNIHHLFVEELAEPRAAEVIKNEFRKHNHEIEILELHGYHNITSTQAKENVTYADLYETNVANIKKALNA